MKALPPSVQKVQDALIQAGFKNQVVEFPAGTRTAKEAADAIGCTVSQIAKSLIFRGQESETAILVIASGTNRVNEARLADIIGEPVEKPDAAFVLAETGFAIGGVPPTSLAQPLKTFIDEDLLKYAEIWAAAGSPNAVFSLTPAELQRLAPGRLIRIT